ncbi:hypothetical protein [Methanothermococcus okinawensis]|uniref:Uncharacterized protein n=1 Tax=Methanothermococcus okinawensis (strain DSM 14208 / JCM 11175 / IH1) TaxID=647113 RepID=F8AK91_METOI|nr:hypothetical protein [Methanothermococcus okinawensis]AEH07464.1 hypothetical protein Metok_1501 [Methanothermococcus okinawensis IH1]
MEGGSCIKSLDLIFGCGYIICGIMELLSFAGINLSDVFTGDLFGSIALLTIGSVYLVGFKKSIHDSIRGVSYGYTASLMGVGIAIIYILTIVSNALGYYVGMDDYADWCEISIYLILGIITVIPFYMAKNIQKSSLKNAKY